MRSYKNITEMIRIILKKGVKIEFEDRKSLRYKTYNSINHAEILNFWNKADNLLWDAQVFGYRKRFPFNKIYKTKKLLGIIWIPNENHKIVLKLSEKGISKDTFKRQIKKYIKY